MGRVKSFFIDAINSTAQRLGFPFSSPQPSAKGKALFAASFSDDEILTRVKRYQLAKVVIHDVSEDCFDKGFIVKNLEDKTDEKLNEEYQRVFKKIIKKPVIKALKLSRALGYSILLIGFDDKKELKEPVTGKPRISYLLAISKKKVVELKISKELPSEIEYVKIQDVGKITQIHPDRFIHMENEGLDDDKKGESALMCVMDLLTVQKNADWAIGQRLWRWAAGLLAVFFPSSITKSTDIDRIENMFAEVNSKSVLTLPSGYDAKTVGPEGKAVNVRDAYSIIVDQIAAGVRIPTSVLSGAVAGTGKAPRKDLDDYGNTLSTIQSNQLVPVLDKIFGLMGRAGQLTRKKYGIEWNPIYKIPPYENARDTFRTVLAETMKEKIKDLDNAQLTELSKSILK